MLREAATVVKGAVSRGDIWSPVTIEMGNGLDGNTSINLNLDQRRRETARPRQVKKQQAKPGALACRSR